MFGRRKRKTIDGAVRGDNASNIAGGRTRGGQRVALSRLENSAVTSRARSGEDGADGEHPQESNKPRDRAHARQPGQDHGGSIEIVTVPRHPERSEGIAFPRGS